MRTLLDCLVVVLVLAGVVAAEEAVVELPVGDLLHAPAHRLAPSVSGRVLDSNGVSSRHVAGEAGLLADSATVTDEESGERGGGADALTLAPDTLEMVVISLVGKDGQEIRVDSSAEMLRVPGEVAEAAKAALATVRANRPAWVDVTATLEEVPAAGPAVTLFSSRGSVLSGRPAVWADARDTVVVADYDVEVAQASSIANPLPTTWTTGSSLTLLAHPLPGSDVAVLEAVARVAEPREPESIDLGHPGFGRLDRCAVGIDEVGLAFLARSGETTEHVWTGRDGRTLRLRIAPRFAAPPPLASDVGLVWSPLLAQGLVGFSIESRPSGDEGEEPDESVLVPAHRVPGWPTTEEQLGRAGLALFDGRDGRRPSDAVAALSRAFRESLRGATVDVRVIEVASGQETPFGGALPPGAALRARFAGPVLDGVSVCAGGTQEKMYVRDWDVEIAQAARVPDPIIGRVCEGHGIGVRLEGGAAGMLRTLHLDVLLERIERLDRQVMPLDVALSSTGTHGDIRQGGNAAMGSTDTAPAFPQDVVAVEKPVVRRLRILTDVPLGADGRGVARRSAVAFAGPGREIVVLVEVR